MSIDNNIVGLSALSFSAMDYAGMKNVVESGIKAVEISYGNLEAAEKFDFKKAKETADKCGLKLWSYHLPFLPFEKLDPSSLDREKSEYTFNTFSRLIKRGTEIGIDKFVVHPSAEPIDPAERPQRLKASAEFLSRLADEAEKYGAVIAVEDLPRTCLGNCSDEILYILGFNEKLRVCFDTNHLLGEEPVDFVKKIGSKIITLHVSDYDFVNERHWLPGEGDIDWQLLYKAIKDSGYDGVWMYELSLEPKKGMDRQLEYSQIYQNATEIFSLKKPTGIGQRSENLGFWG